MKTFKQLLWLGFLGILIGLALLIFLPFVRTTVMILAIIPIILFGGWPGIIFALLSYWFAITFVVASIYYFFIHKEPKDSHQGA